MSRIHGAIAAALVCAGAVAASSCDLTSGGGRSGLPRTPQSTVALTMTEYRFDYKEPVPSGRVVFRVRNAGRSRHSLTLLPLSEDIPPIAEQLRGRKRRIIAPLAGVHSLAPGSRDTFAADLVPGQRYALIDFSPSPSGQSNALRGMSSEFRTASRPGPGS